MRIRALQSFAGLTIFAVVAASFTIGTASFAQQEKSPQFPTPPPGFRIGPEIELLPSAFANLTSYFDFSELQKTNGHWIVHSTPADFFDSALADNPNILATLPAEVRARLTEGLDLENSILPERRTLVTSEGKPAERRSSLILPDKKEPEPQTQKLIGLGKPGIIAPPAQSVPLPSALGPEDAFQNRGALLLPKRDAWATLSARWKALRFEEKSRLVNWDLLSPLKKADLAVKYGQSKIKLRADLPEADRRLFSRFEWVKDNDTIEFRYPKSLKVGDIGEFYEDVLGLAKRAGIDFKILHPEKSQLKTASFQFHVSVEGKDLVEVGKALNHLLLIRRLDLGIISDITRDGSYLYDPQASTKGLMKIIEFDHFEVRAHAQSLAEELNFLLKVLALPEKQALRAISFEIQRLMTADVVKRLSGNSAYLSDFFKYLSDAELEKFGPQVAFLEELKKPSARWSAATWKHALERVREGDASVRHHVAEAMRYHRGKWTKEMWETIPHLLEAPEVMTRLSAQNALKAAEEWSPGFWRLVPSLLREAKAEAVYSLVNAMKEKTWPPEVMKAIPAAMQVQSEGLGVALAQGLAKQPQWSAEIWAAMPTMIKNESPSDLIFIFEAIGTRRTWPPSFPAAVRALKDRDKIELEYFLSGAEQAMQDNKRVANDRRRSPAGCGGGYSKMVRKTSLPNQE